MDIHETIAAALVEFGLPIAESLYEGDEKEFFTYVITDDIGDDYGDNEPGTNTIFVQVHFICPWEKDYTPEQKRIRKALHEAGFTWPEVTDYSDEEARIRHKIFECSIDNDYDVKED